MILLGQIYFQIFTINKFMREIQEIKFKSKQKKEIKITALLTVSFTLFLFMHMKRSFKSKFKFATRNSPFYLEINTSSKEMAIELCDISNFGLYLNFQESYSCPYYSDRADLIVPEINRVAQFLRSYGSKIIFYDETKQEKKFLSRPYSKTDDNDPQDLKITSPYFVDKCLFSDFDVLPFQTNYSIHHGILYSSKFDHFLTSHYDLIDLAKALNLTHILMAGMRVNLWMTDLIKKLKKFNIEPLYLWDLNDVAYYKKTQNKVFETHVDAQKAYINYLINNSVRLVNHFSILDRPYLDQPYMADTIFDGNSNAYYFKHFFRGILDEKT